MDRVKARLTEENNAGAGVKSGTGTAAATATAVAVAATDGDEQQDLLGKRTQEQGAADPKSAEDSVAD